MNRQASFLFFLIGIFFIGCGQDNRPSVNSDYNIKTVSGKSEIKTPEILKTGWYLISDSVTDFKRFPDTAYNTVASTAEADKIFFYINPVPVLTSENISSMEMKFYNQHSPVLEIKLDDTGKELWKRITAKITDRNVAFILDDKLVQVSGINEWGKNGIISLTTGLSSQNQSAQLMKLEEIQLKLYSVKVKKSIIN